MFNPFSLVLLSLEAHKVIERRLILLAWGGREASSEAALMVSEKIGAAIEAAGTLVTGGTADSVVSRYREHVSANFARLGG